MEREADPRELVRAVVVAHHRAVGDSVEIVKEKYAGDDAAFAVVFEDRDGVERRGAVGLRNQDGVVWRPSGGFVGSAQGADTWGGWSSGECTVIGGWIADSDAVSARVVDGAGRVLDDVVENGVVLFMWSGDLDDQYAHLESLDAEGRVLRTRPLHP